MVRTGAIELKPFDPAQRHAVLATLRACDVADYGDPDCTRGVLLGQWHAGGARAVVALEDTTVAGYAGMLHGAALVFVHPEHQGRGIGTALRKWTEDQAGGLARTVQRQGVATSNAAALELLSAAGYRRVRTVFHMVRDLGSLPEAPDPPAGVTVSQLDIAKDARALHLADTVAFSENPDYEPESFETFYTMHLANPEVAPHLSLIARRGGRIAGYAVCRTADDVGHIGILAAVAPERRQGLGTFLLRRSFAGFARAGLREATLEVASDNPPARRIYERAGMRARHSFEVLEKPVRRRRR